MVRPHHRAAFERPRPAESSLPVAPFRAPVHQLAIAHRGDVAIVGIAHAGEIIAAVRLDRDLLVAHIEGLIAAAESIGISRAQIAGILGIEAPAPTVIVMPRAPRPTEKPCDDCGATIAVLPRGKIPQRCPSCTADYHRQYARDYMRTFYEQRKGRTG